MKIIFKDKTYDANMVKGDLKEHWGNIKQWSLKISLKNKKTIKNRMNFL